MFFPRCLLQGSRKSAVANRVASEPNTDVSPHASQKALALFQMGRSRSKRSVVCGSHACLSAVTYVPVCLHAHTHTHRDTRYFSSPI